MSDKPLMKRTGIVTPPAAKCDRILVDSSAKPGNGRLQPCRWRKRRPCLGKGYLVGSPNNKMDRTKEHRDKGPTARSLDNRGTSRSKCKARSLSDRRPCCPQLFDRVNPTPATRPFVTCQYELVPGQPALDLCATDSGIGLDAQKFAFAGSNNC